MKIKKYESDKYESIEDVKKEYLESLELTSLTAVFKKDNESLTIEVDHTDLPLNNNLNQYCGELLIQSILKNIFIAKCEKCGNITENIYEWTYSPDHKHYYTICNCGGSFSDLEPLYEYILNLNINNPKEIYCFHCKTIVDKRTKVCVNCGSDCSVFF